MKQNKKNKAERAGTGLIAGGLFLLVVSAALLGYNLWDNQRAAAVSDEIVQQLFSQEDTAGSDQSDSAVQAERPLRAETVSADVPLYIKYPDMEMPTVEIDGHTYIGRLDIPTLGLSLPVMSQWSYPNLKISPCRYTGSAYTGDLVIAAHNYQSHFGTLKYLSCGDRVYFTDADGNEFTYEVAEIDQLLPTDIEKMTSGDWALTLFTCTIGGSYRVTVRCDAVSSAD
jgi:sortase A